MNTTLINIAAAVMLVIGLRFLYTLFWKSPTRRPQDAVEWTGAALSLALVVASTALLFMAQAQVASPPAPVDAAGYPTLAESELNAPAPDFSFRRVADDGVGALSDFRGKVVLVNFWATWCAPCRQELPDLNALQAAYADEGLVVLNISDEPREELLAFDETIRLETVSGYVAGPGVLPEPYRRTIAVRPTSYVIDRDGYIRQYILGARSFAAFETMVTPHLRAAGSVAAASR